MNGTTSALPQIVYLDQFVWVEILRGPTRGNTDPDDAKEMLLRMRRRGQVRVPLSSTHYLETWHRRDYPSLVRLAELMRDISQYDTIAPVHVTQRSGVADALAQLAGSPPPLRPTIISRGANHAFASPTGRFRAVEWLATEDRDEGPALGIEAFLRSPRDREVLKKVSGRDEWEWLNLAGHEELFDRLADGLDRTPEHRHGTASMNRELALRNLLRTDRRAFLRLADLLIADEFERMLDDVNEIARRHRFDLHRWLQREGPAGIRWFVDGVPTSNVLARLREHRHRNLEYPIEQHDRTDLYMLANVIPNCDVVVTEKRWVHAARQTGLAERYSTKMFSSLKELIGHLEEIEQGGRPNQESNPGQPMAP